MQAFRPIRGGRIALAATLVAMATGALASAASAATITGTSSDPIFTAAAGEINNLVLNEDPITGQITFTDDNPIGTVVAGCVINTPTSVTCPALESSITIDLGDMNDQTTFSGVDAGIITEDGGPGNDTLRSSPQADAVTMIGGPGGPGDADTFVGSTTQDTVSYGARTAAVNATLDGAANDGEPGEGDNIGAAIDNLTGGAGNDTLTGNDGDNALNGSGGNDVISGLGAQDVITGGGGDDSIDGGAGDDFISGDQGADDIHGGTGIDSVQEFSFGGGAPTSPLDGSVTLDDVGNDGAANEGDNIHSDVEDVTMSSGADTLVGSAGANILDGDGGNDSIDGGPGNDLLFGGDGNDTIHARDGFADRVDCGGGNDTAIVDTLDVVSATCETVDRADVGNANDIAEDAPPTVSITSLKPGQQISPRAPTSVAITAGDDHGVARVVLIDDGVVVGTDTTAPYAIGYQPKGSDVGRNTLIAMAIDGANQTATAVVPVTVTRFTPKAVGSAVSPVRDRTAPFRFRTSGAIQLPANVTRAQACRGQVTVRIKRGTRTLATSHPTVGKTCRYSTTASFARLGSGRLRVTVRFEGNSVLAARSARTRTIRAG